jgi:hypothetical protein
MAWHGLDGVGGGGDVSTSEIISGVLQGAYKWQRLLCDLEELWHLCRVRAGAAPSCPGRSKRLGRPPDDISVLFLSNPLETDTNRREGGQKGNGQLKEEKRVNEERRKKCACVRERVISILFIHTSRSFSPFRTILLM